MSKQTFEDILIDQILSGGKNIPLEWQQEPRILVRLMRKRLKMTQKQLAKRAGVPQSNIANIEAGHSEATLRTLQKLFGAMGCSLALLPIPEIMPDAMRETKALQYAEKGLEYTFQTMVLEEQLPNEKARRTMVKETQKELLNSNSRTIWDLDD